MNVVDYKLDELIKFKSDEQILKSYHAFIYPKGKADGFIIITNLRLMILSVINKKKQDNYYYKDIPINNVGGIKLEYGMRKKKNYPFLLSLCLFFSLVTLLISLLLLFQLQVLYSIISFISFISFLSLSIVCFVFRFQKTFYLEINKKLENSIFISLSSKDYTPLVDSFTFLKPGADTFKMLSEISTEIHKAKEYKLLENKINVEALKGKYRINKHPFLKLKLSH